MARKVQRTYREGGNEIEGEEKALLVEVVPAGSVDLRWGRAKLLQRPWGSPYPENKERET